LAEPLRDLPAGQ
jgi:hypothetical protein